MYENYQELLKLEEDFKKSKLFHIRNETQLKNLLSNEDYVHGIFYYFNETDMTDEIIARLASYPDFILIAQVDSTILFPILQNFTNDSKFMNEISDRTKFKYGGMAMMPPGNFQYKLSNTIVFDELNVTNMMVQ